MSFTNPIIPGFYPDPSCIRVGDTFYLANSSFQFFPGIPIHKSKDLINWELIGNAINRPSQISLATATTKINNAARREIFTGGIYAPTLRFHDGVFYIVCTNLTGTEDMPPDADLQPANFVITATNLEDPSSFSDLIYFDFYGIDPSLFFDDRSGKVYVQGSWIYGYDKDQATVIRQAEIDLTTGKLLTEARDIWGGATGKVPEGPHLYKKDRWYYLLIAEGGTFGGHKITMARSRDIWGPYDSYTRNPVLTADGSSGPIQCVGHGDIFEDAAGQWWCVMLARREVGRSFPLGRETYMTPVKWEEGQFPVFDRVRLNQVCSGRDIARKIEATGFTGVSLASPSTLYLRSPELENYQQVEKEITLTPTEAELGAPAGTLTFVGQRQTSLDSVARVLLPLSGNGSPLEGSCGLTVYKDTFRYVALEYSARNSTLSLKIQEPLKPLTTLRSVAVRGAASILLSITSTAEAYTFECVKSATAGGREGEALGQVACSALSGDDFTGTVYAIYACGRSTPVTFRDFEIKNES
ncbi:putative xylosidase/arabinosidase [Aspergillus lucknowensis]|uniref:Glycosyl hydrolase n=1 Tax=Aspergillus lucknowensis TaxID=176173 RepID=A0ABR4M4Z3_9EURO